MHFREQIVCCGRIRLQKGSHHGKPNPAGTVNRVIKITRMGVHKVQFSGFQMPINRMFGGEMHVQLKELVLVAADIQVIGVGVGTMDVIRRSPFMFFCRGEGEARAGRIQLAKQMTRRRRRRSGASGRDGSGDVGHILTGLFPLDFHALVFLPQMVLDVTLRERECCPRRSRTRRRAGQLPSMPPATGRR